MAQNTSDRLASPYSFTPPMYPVPMNPVSSQMHLVSSRMYPVQMNPVSSQMHPVNSLMYPIEMNPVSSQMHPVNSLMYPIQMNPVSSQMHLVSSRMYPVQMNPVSSQMHPVNSLMYPIQMNPVSSQMHPVSSPMYPGSCCRGNASRPNLECAGNRLVVLYTTHWTPHNMCLSHSGLIQFRVEMSAFCCIKTKHLLSVHTPI